jgi:hypothetical protein
MKDLDKAAFQDSRNALLSARIQARLQFERRNNAWLDSVLQEEEKINGYSKPVPLVNQATFLAMLYATALWLRETYFSEEPAVAILRHHIRPFVGNCDINVTYGPNATQFTQEKSEQFARRIRNALGHASITVSENSFTFKDVNPRNQEDWVEVEMPWSTVGEYTESLIAAGNALLYAQPNNPPDWPKSAASL